MVTSMIRQAHLGKRPRLFLIPTFLVLLNLLVGVNLAHAATIWKVVPGAAVQPNTFKRSLQAVTAVSQNDVWSVGSVTFDDGVNFTTQPLAEHWNGSAWSIVPTPGIGAFNAISADATNDVWAVGDNTDPNTGNSTPIIERWNGTSWSAVKGFVDPIPASADEHDLNVTGVAALAPNNVWVAGWWFDNTDDSALIEHWNGSSWTVTPEPPVLENSGLSILNGITAISPTDMWVVGQYESFNGLEGEVAQAWHFDGKQWSLVLPTDPAQSGAASLDLNAVSAASSNDVWAVGDLFNPSSDHFVGLAMHWNGSTWTNVPVPAAQTPSDVVLSGVAAVASNDVWAVGEPGANGSALMEHWNGSQWSVVSLPAVSSFDSLAGIAKTGSQSLWAVGASDNASTGVDPDTLIMNTTNG
jgi:hypothetical protein